MLQANEALKIITGFGKPLSGRLLVYNLITNSQDVFEVEKKKDTQVSEKKFKPEMISITDAIHSQGIFLDVRSSGELPELVHERCVQIALSDLPDQWQNLNPNEALFIFCKSGTRSVDAAEMLDQLGFQKIKLIKGGAKELAEKLTYEKDIS